MSSVETLFRIRRGEQDVTRVLGAQQVARFREWENPLLEDALSSDEWHAIGLVHELAKVKQDERARFTQRVREGKAHFREKPILDARLNAVLTLRADAEADWEGALWTPLLDAIEFSGMSPHVMEGNEALPLSPSLLHPGRNIPEWIRGCTESQALQRIALYRSPALLATLAEETPLWDKRLLIALLAAEPKLVSTIASRENFPDTLIPEVTSWCISRMERGEQDMGGRVMMGEDSTALSHLHWKGRYEPSARELDHLLTSVHRGEYELMRNRMNGVVFEPAKNSWTDVLRLLLSFRMGTLGEKRFKACYEASSTVPILAVEAIRHGDATIEMKRRVLSRSRYNPAVQDALLEDREARGDEGVRAELRKCERVEVYTSLLRDAEGEEVPILFRWLAEKAPGRALAEVKRRESTLLGKLSPADFAPLLASLDAEERLDVIRMLGEQAKPQREVTEEGNAPRRRRRRR